MMENYKLIQNLGYLNWKSNFMKLNEMEKEIEKGKFYQFFEV